MYIYIYIYCAGWKSYRKRSAGVKPKFCVNFLLPFMKLLQE